MRAFHLSYISILLALSFLLPKHEPAKENPVEGSAVQWMSFEEAVKRNAKEKRKIFIDVYTDWCGWCKVMDKNTFTHPVIAKYLNEKYYAVKLNAEMKDTVIANNTTYVNPNPTGKRSTHQLAAALLNGKMSYPTVVFLDENFNMLTPMPGYQKPEQIEPVLSWFAFNHYKETKFEDYVKIFKSQLNN